MGGIAMASAMESQSSLDKFEIADKDEFVFAPETGNVVFCSALDCWAFRWGFVVANCCNCSNCKSVNEESLLFIPHVCELSCIGRLFCSSWFVWVVSKISVRSLIAGQSVLYCIPRCPAFCHSPLALDSFSFPKLMIYRYQTDWSENECICFSPCLLAPFLPVSVRLQAFWFVKIHPASWIVNGLLF